MTAQILADWKYKEKSTMYGRLRVLVEQGYVQKRYDKKWKLLGRPAVYSLTGKGLRAVRDNRDYFSEAVIRNQYKNKSASLELIDHSLDLAGISLNIADQYGKRCFVTSKSEIHRRPEFIRPLPDLSIVLTSEDQEEEVRYQLEVIEAGTLTWIIKKRINAHQEWYEENSYEDWYFQGSYPNLLLVCDNNSTERRIHKLVDDSLMDFEVFTVTRERLDSKRRAVWLQYWDEDDMEFEALKFPEDKEDD